MDDPTERWLPVPGWEGLYEVSDLGRVRSLPRQTPTGVRGGRMLKQCRDGAGYLHVGMSRGGGTQKSRKVHRLVAEAFLDPPEPGMQVRHGPGGQLDNRLVNLCWGTPAEDSADKIRDGTMNFGERHGLAKLTDADVDDCRRRAATGENQVALAREYGVTQATMWNALTSKTWRQASAPPVVPGDGRGERHGMARLTAADVAEIRRRAAAGEFQRVIAADYGVRRQHISRIVNRVRWRDF